MAGIKEYDTTAGNNSTINSIDISEGCAPSGINNAIRQILADSRSQWNDANWFEYGDGDGSFTIAYASGTSFTVNGIDVTSIYHAGRRVRAVGSSTGTIYGTISSSSFSTNTTVNVTWDSGSLSNESLTISLSILDSTNSGIPVLNQDLEVNGTVTATSYSGDGSSLTGITGGTAWQTVKTGNFTAVASEGYFVNTTSGAITATLPASPTQGDEVSFIDYAGTFDTNNLTIGRNSKPIQGDASDLTVATERAGLTLVFVDDTQGWLLKEK